jgi:biopolymer transport protein ExbD/biopolymer transport protein TolR
MTVRQVLFRTNFCSAILIGFLSLCASAQGVKVDLPGDFRNALPDRAALSDSAILIAIPNENEFYLNGRHVEQQSLGREIERLIQGKSAGSKIAYLACGASIPYRVVIGILNVVRDQDIGQIGLIVDPAAKQPATPMVFSIEVPMPWKPGMDLRKLKPNPLTLVAAVSSDGELTLNHDSGPKRGQLCFASAPNGFGTDPLRLQKWLECLFENRTRQRVYAIGMETRAEVPLAQRTEKTVFVKGALSLKYVDVLRVIDAVKGSGAHPVGLQIDDLRE